jgi:thiol-disulfide isomerase/thioredoxin
MFIAAGRLLRPAVVYSPGKPTMRTLILLALCLALPAGAADLSKLKPWTAGAAPPLVLKDLQGKQHDLARYRGRVVVLNFWATWCAPCVKEMPALANLERNLAGERFALLTVNFGESEKRVQPFIDKLGVDFTVLLDRDMTATRAWVGKGLPTTYVIAADGSIRHQVLGELEWDAPAVEAKIRELLPKR